MTTTTLNIVGMPYIDIAAVRRRSTSALAIWYVGRVLAVDGVVRIADLEHHFPRQSLDRLLTDGTGTFWASNHLKRGVLFCAQRRG